MLSKEPPVSPTPLPPQVRFLDYPRYCPRTDTASKIDALLDHEEILHIRGTRHRGSHFLPISFTNIFFLATRKSISSTNGCRIEETPPELVLSTCLLEGCRTIAQLIRSKMVLILDESQYTYSDSGLWYKSLKIAGGNAGPANDVRVCLFSSYGSPTTIASQMNYPESIMPSVFSNHQHISCAFLGHGIAWHFFVLPKRRV